MAFQALRPVMRRGEPVALAGRDRFHLLAPWLADSDPELLLVMALCLYHRQVLRGALPEPAEPDVSRSGGRASSSIPDLAWSDVAAREISITRAAPVRGRISDRLTRAVTAGPPTGAVHPSEASEVGTATAATTRRSCRDRFELGGHQQAAPRRRARVPFPQGGVISV
jgi:hypothetical protein